MIAMDFDSMSKGTSVAENKGGAENRRANLHHDRRKLTKGEP